MNQASASVSVSPQEVVKLRGMTGAGFLDCKKALAESAGNVEKAKDILRSKGLAGAASKSDRVTSQGCVSSYVHHSGKVGVLLELNCETDFVAKTPDFQELAKELALQIAAAKPRWVRQEDVPKDVLEKEREIYRGQAATLGKPAGATQMIVEGKLSKFFSDFCLVEQASIRDTSGKTKISGQIAQAIAKLGENIAVCRFVRFEVGE
mgnify:CR=1 FL=1